MLVKTTLAAVRKVGVMMMSGVERRLLLLPVQAKVATARVVVTKMVLHYHQPWHYHVGQMYPRPEQHSFSILVRNAVVVAVAALMMMTTMMIIHEIPLVVTLIAAVIVAPNEHYYY